MFELPCGAQHKSWITEDYFMSFTVRFIQLQRSINQPTNEGWTFIIFIYEFPRNISCFTHFTPSLAIYHETPICHHTALIQIMLSQFARKINNGKTVKWLHAVNKNWVWLFNVKQLWSASSASLPSTLNLFHLCLMENSLHHLQRRRIIRWHEERIFHSRHFRSRSETWNFVFSWNWNSIRFPCLEQFQALILIFMVMSFVLRLFSGIIWWNTKSLSLSFLTFRRNLALKMHAN